MSTDTLERKLTLKKYILKPLSHPDLQSERRSPGMTTELSPCYSFCACQSDLCIPPDGTCVNGTCPE